MNNLTSSNEEIDMIKDVIKDFGENEINPITSDIELNSEIPSSILEKVLYVSKDVIITDIQHK